MSTSNITTQTIKELRQQSGAGIMSCKKALMEAEGDMERARELLKQQSVVIIEKKAQRAATQGIVEAYVHNGNRIGVLLELNCETDFVARTDEFKALAHHIAMQVAALSPQYISETEIAEGDDQEPATSCLLLQPDIKDPSVTVQDIINETIARVGENIKVGRFARYELGE